MLNNKLTITLTKQEEKQLSKASSMYGFGLEELSRHIIVKATKNLMEIPEESLDEYENAEEIKESYQKAMQAEKSGQLLHSLKNI